MLLYIIQIQVWLLIFIYRTLSVSYETHCCLTFMISICNCSSHHLIATYRLWAFSDLRDFTFKNYFCSLRWLWFIKNANFWMITFFIKFRYILIINGHWNIKTRLLLSQFKEPMLNFKGFLTEIIIARLTLFKIYTLGM